MGQKQMKRKDKYFVGFEGQGQRFLGKKKYDYEWISGMTLDEAKRFAGSLSEKVDGKILRPIIFKMEKK